MSLRSRPSAPDLRPHGGDSQSIEQASLDMSAAFIKAVTEQLPNAAITFDKFHVIAHAHAALGETRRLEETTDAGLKGLCWTLRKDRSKLTTAQRADLDAWVAQAATRRTARAWIDKEQLREVLDCKQINVARACCGRGVTRVMRSKVQPMKKVARMIRSHFDGIAHWCRSRHDQRVPGGHQRPVPGRQAARPRLYPRVHHAHGDPPDSAANRTSPL